MVEARKRSISSINEVLLGTIKMKRALYQLILKTNSTLHNNFNDKDFGVRKR